MITTVIIHHVFPRLLTTSLFIPFSRSSLTLPSHLAFICFSVRQSVIKSHKEINQNVIIFLEKEEKDVQILIKNLFFLHIYIFYQKKV